jgi:hypothetical protein
MHACMWHAKYCWKALFFRLHFNQKYVEEVVGVPISKSRESQEKMTFGCSRHGQSQKNYKGEGGGFPQVRVVVSLVNLCMFVVHLCTKNVLTMH